MPEVPSCLGDCCRLCFVGALASLCPRCLRAWVRGAGGDLSLFTCFNLPNQFMPEVLSCLGAWCWYGSLVSCPLCARGAFVPGCVVLVGTCLYLFISFIIPNQFMPEVPSCLGAGCWLCLFGVLPTLCPRCLRAWVLGAGAFLLLFICVLCQTKGPRCLRAWVLDAGCVCLVSCPLCARGAFVPGCVVLVGICFIYLFILFYLTSLRPRCLRAWVLGACCVCWCPAHFVPEVPSCLGAWCWWGVLVSCPLCLRGAFVPGCWGLKILFIPDLFVPDVLSCGATETRHLNN